MFGSIFSLYSHEIGEDNSKIPHLNLVIWGLNKPIPLSFLSHVDYLNQLIILVIFQWTQSNMSLSFFFTLRRANLEGVLHLQPHKGWWKRLNPWFSFGGWNCLQANLCNGGLSIRVFNCATLAVTVNTSLFQSRGCSGQLSITIRRT